MPSKHDPEQARSELDPGWTPVSRLREAQQRSRRFRCMLSAGEGRSHRPQVHFVKNASDAAACPAEHEGCEHPSYLVPGDLLLVGKSRGAFSCASYQSAADRRQNWTVGWLPSASLTPVQPARALRTANRRVGSYNSLMTAVRRSTRRALRPAVVWCACSGSPNCWWSRTMAT